ncbi:hypothetical protein R3W88_029418 [Solanum pinnatisectum]|uniref:Proteinase inhibitor n=1 Tax=Solanum pinnatisectum TaxID=50273 RepID=A0AAV9K6C4_9SOLN|nr:hypothetical protein R3W88_029418 [Solanum pinnatisectum]
MAFNKVALLILLAIFAGTILLLSQVDAAPACPRNCNPTIQYGRCPKSGNKKFKVGCTNCCSGTKGCNYFSINGTFICEGQTKKTIDETNKVVP